MCKLMVSLGQMLQRGVKKQKFVKISRFHCQNFVRKRGKI